MRDHLVKGHDGEIDGVRECRLPEIKESKGDRSGYTCTTENRWQGCVNLFMVG